MAFGLIHWLSSFIIFLVVLSIITWSAVHLAKKDENFTANFPDNSILENDESFTTMILYTTTIQPIESVNDSTTFANQGSEILHNKDFLRIFREHFSTPNYVNNSENTANSTPPIVYNESPLNEKTTTPIYDPFDESPSFGDRQNISEKKKIKLSNDVPQITDPSMSHGAKFSDLDRLWKTDLHKSVGLELANFLRNEKNGSSNASVAFSFVQVSPDPKRLNATKRAGTT